MAFTGSTSSFLPTRTTFSTSTTSPSSPDMISTPYTYRPICDPHVLGSLTTASPPTRDALKYSTFLCVDPSSSSWQDCQPQTRIRVNAGYPEGVYSTTMAGASGIYYIAAVCPEGWWALDVYAGGTTNSGTVILESSYATCCKSGDTLTQDIFALYWTSSYGQRQRSICVNSWKGSTRFVESRVKTRTGFEATDDTVTVPITEGTAYYPGWTIRWKSTDTASLSPKWPTLTSDRLIPTWTSGMVIRDGQYDKKAPVNDGTSEKGTEEGGSETNGGHIPPKAWKGIIIGGIFGFLVLCFLLGCCCWGWRSCWKKAEERKERRRAAGVPPLGQRMKERFRRVKKVGDQGDGGSAGMTLRMTEVRQGVPQTAENNWWRWNSSGGKGKTAAETTGVKVDGDSCNESAAALQAPDEAELARRFEVLRRQMAEGKDGVGVREVRTPIPMYQGESERKRIPIPSS